MKTKLIVIPRIALAILGESSSSYVWIALESLKCDSGNDKVMV